MLIINNFNLKFQSKKCKSYVIIFLTARIKTHNKQIDPYTINYTKFNSKKIG